MTGNRKRVVFVAFVLSGSVAFGFAWSSFTDARLSRPPIRGDASHYVSLYRGVELSEIEPPFRYRVFTPYLARLAPPLPRWLVSDHEIRVTSEARVVFRFAIVNALGLAVASSLLFLFLAELGFSSAEGLLGSLLFLTSYFPAVLATTPLVDAWAYAFLAMGLYALVTGRTGLLLVSFTLGLFNKESSLLLPVAAALLPAPAAVRSRQALVFLPPLALYLVFRFVVHPAPEALAEYSHQGAYAQRLLLGNDFLMVPKEIFRSFHVLWVFAALGWTKVDVDSPLYRWRWLVLVVLVAPFVLVKGLGRTWSFAFPFVVPLALLGMRGWISGEASVADESPEVSAK